MSTGFCCSQFQVKNFGFKLENPSLICTAQCNKQQLCYIFYRLAWALWWVAFVVYDLYGAVKSSSAIWLLYLTKQGCLLILLSSVLQLITALAYRILGQETNSKLSVLCRISWIVYELSSPLALVISVMYWITIHEGPVKFISFGTHAINSLYVLIDVFITASPIRLLHMYMAVLYAVFYSLLSVAAQLGFGLDALYPIVDFHKKPYLALGICLISMALVAVSHSLLFLLYWVRLALYKHCCDSSKSDSSKRAKEEVALNGISKDGEKHANEPESVTDEEIMPCV